MSPVWIRPHCNLQNSELIMLGKCRKWQAFIDAVNVVSAVNVVNIVTAVKAVNAVHIVNVVSALRTS